jgi:hypothetical protein
VADRQKEPTVGNYDVMPKEPCLGGRPGLNEEFGFLVDRRPSPAPRCNPLRADFAVRMLASVLSNSSGAWCNERMKISTFPSYRGYRFPPEVIAHCVWLYYRFCLSFRDIQEMMLERGVGVSYEAIRLWTLKFGIEYARRIRRRRGHVGDTWYLDEVFCKINGQQVYLWRAVDQDGEVLDLLVQKRRNAKAAKRFFRKLLKGLQ